MVATGSAVVSKDERWFAGTRIPFEGQPELVTIVVVDDMVDGAELLAGSSGSRLSRRRGPRWPSALALIHAEPPDLILLDINMPGMNGYAVCEKVKRDGILRNIPVILLTALSEIGDRLRGLQVGADDFISKPVERTELLIRVRSLVRIKRQHDELDRSHQVLVSLALALEARDPYTRTHSQNVAAFACQLARWLKLDEEVVRQIEEAGLIHDIGKVGLPDSILTKNGPLTAAEFALMQTHPVATRSADHWPHSATPSTPSITTTSAGTAVVTQTAWPAGHPRRAPSWPSPTPTTR
jgi:putative two-component system response regulator